MECKQNVRKKKVVNTLKSAVHGSRDTKCKKNVDESTSGPMSKFMQCSSRPNLNAAHVREEDSKLAQDLGAPSSQVGPGGEGSKKVMPSLVFFC